MRIHQISRRRGRQTQRRAPGLTHIHSPHVASQHFFRCIQRLDAKQRGNRTLLWQKDHLIPIQHNVPAAFADTQKAPDALLKRASGSI